MICDLNVPWPATDFTTLPNSTQIQNLKKVLLVLEELGYTNVALNLVINQSVKIPKTFEKCPIDLSLVAEFQQRLSLSTRITLTVSEPAQLQGLNKLYPYFDLVAIAPVSEKALQTAVTNLDIDIISLQMHERLPCFLKHKTVCAAVDRGVFFEICYSALIGGSQGFHAVDQALARRNFLNNSKSLIRSSRSRGLISCSFASDALQCRGSFDVANILVVLGLKADKAVLTTTENPSRALLKGKLRTRSYKQTIAAGAEDSKELVGQKRRFSNALEREKRRKL